jgi:hypothetical protein
MLFPGATPRLLQEDAHSPPRPSQRHDISLPCEWSQTTNSCGKLTFLMLMWWSAKIWDEQSCWRSGCNRALQGMVSLELLDSVLKMKTAKILVVKLCCCQLGIGCCWWHDPEESSVCGFRVFVACDIVVVISWWWWLDMWWQMTANNDYYTTTTSYCHAQCHRQ